MTNTNTFAHLILRLAAEEEPDVLMGAAALWSGWFHLEPSLDDDCKTRHFCVRSELGGNIDDLTPKLNAVIAACEGIINSQSLKEFLGFILQTGNFMNMVMKTDCCLLILIPL